MPTAAIPMPHLRDFDATDATVLAQAFTDARVLKFYGLSTTHRAPMAIAREQLAWYAQLAADGEGWWQAICTPRGELIGGVGVYDRDDDGDCGDLGFWLLPTAWGQGWMRGAVLAFLSPAFARLRLHSLQAYVEPENQASVKLLNGLGFVHEGLLRECTRRVQGGYTSLHRFSMIEHELPARD